VLHGCYHLLVMRCRITQPAILELLSELYGAKARFTGVIAELV
jgi:hypothetical protein